MKSTILDKTKLVNSVFSKVYKKYDLMNDIMSLGVHRIWKKKLIDWMNPQLNDNLVDVASGTGDIAKLFSKKTKSSNTISCVEPNDEMYSTGKDNLKNFKNKYSYFKMTSNRFFSKNKHMFDVIYIDGWHGTSQVFKDISNSWKILNDGGIIICDDYFYGNIYKNSDKNIPAPAINNFIKKNKKKLKIVCVNNNQIFIKKIK